MCQGLQDIISTRNPDFLPFHSVDRVTDAAALNARCKRRGGSEASNPYEDPSCGFHITFYERLEDASTVLDDKLRLVASKKGLRFGRLYEPQRAASVSPGTLRSLSQINDDQNSRVFRESAFTAGLRLESLNLPHIK